MSNPTTLLYKGFPAEFRYLHYFDGNRCLRLYSPETVDGGLGPWEGDLIATCSINIPDTVPPDHIAVKNYSENKGMVDFLVRKGQIEPESTFRIQTGHTSTPCHRLTPRAIAAFKEVEEERGGERS